jgi:hypothetical protein
MADVALEPQRNDRGAPQSRLRVRGAARSPEEDAEVDEIRRNGWMIRAEVGFIDGQGTHWPCEAAAWRKALRFSALRDHATRGYFNAGAPRLACARSSGVTMFLAI